MTAEMMNDTSLLDLACRSALWRIRDKIQSNMYYYPDGENNLTAWPGRWDRCVPLARGTDLLDDLVGPIGYDMRRLGRQSRDTVEDLRTSPYWSLLECKDSFQEGFERNRPIDIKYLTPMAIYRCLEMGNILRHAGWKVTVGGSREVTGDYGEPAWESRIWVSPPVGKLIEFSGVSKSLARKIYATIAGAEFLGVDTLGFDDPHDAENISYSQMMDWMEMKKRVPLITSHESGDLWDAFQMLSVEDPAACFALFDSHGRYLDKETGFWASLRCERYDDKDAEWFRYYERYPDECLV